jgi:hypothetical protein
MIRSAITAASAFALFAIANGCALHHPHRHWCCDDGCGLSGRFDGGVEGHAPFDGHVVAPGGCASCDGDCGPGGCVGYTPLGWLKNRLTCGGGCGELYIGEWHYDPPDACDPCDDHGNWIGPRCCERNPMFKHGWRSLWGFRHCHAGEVLHEDVVEFHPRPVPEEVAPPKPMPKPATRTPTPAPAKSNEAHYYTPGGATR